jgi:hypothetical protein
MDNFKVKKSQSFGYFLLFSSIVIIFLAFGLPFLSGDSFSISGLLITFFIAVTIVGLFIWLWFDTYYMIDKDILIAKSGPFVWRVPIGEIFLIRLNQKTIGGTWKPTLSWDSIELRYKKHHSIYISPLDETRFLDSLIKINDKIEIKS